MVEFLMEREKPNIVEANYIEKWNFSKLTALFASLALSRNRQKEQNRLLFYSVAIAKHEAIDLTHDAKNEAGSF